MTMMKNLTRILLFLTIVLMSEARSSYCLGEQKIYLNLAANFSVEVESFKPEGEASRLVLIIPPTGGRNFIDRSYGKHFCQKGIEGLIITGWTGDKKTSFDLDIHKSFYENAQMAIDTVLDRHQHQKVGILGTSVGGIHSAISWARNATIQSAFLIVGGGDIARIIATSDQGVLVEAKEARFKKLGFKNDEEYIEALRKILPYEPLSLPLERKERKLGMMVSLSDTTVPTVCQEELRTAWKPDVEMFSNWGHTSTVVKTWLLNQDSIVQFFVDSL